MAAAGTLLAVSDNPYRLPHTVLPSRYRLVLEPDLGGASFAGTVSIDVTASAAVQSVALNADELEITQYSSVARNRRSASTRRPSGSSSMQRSTRATPRSTSPSPARSTTSCAAGTAARSRTRTASSGSLPQRRCRPPIAAERSRASTSRSSRPSSTSPSSSSPTCWPSPTARRPVVSPAKTASTSCRSSRR